MYFKDAFGPELDPVVLSAGRCTPDQIVLPSSELPYLHGNATIEPRDVPAVFGNGVNDAGDTDMAPAVLFPDIHAAKRPAVHLLDLPTLYCNSAR